MPIVTSEEVIELLNNPDLSDQQGVIEKLIPLLQDWFIHEFHNDFRTSNYITSAGILFVADDTITEGSGNFLMDGVEFEDDMDFVVEGSKLNDGIYFANTIVGATITLADGWVVVNEDFTVTVTIYRAKWPVGLKYWAAKAIEYDLQLTAGMTETQDTNEDIAKYPVGVMDAFGAYRNFPVG